MKRAADYRQSLIDVTLFLDGKLNQKFVTLLKQLVEIQETAYADENNRSIRKIFRLHNLTFVHGMLMKELIPVPIKLTKRKLFGHYHHAIVSHAAIQYRIIALSSCNTCIYVYEECS